MSSHLRIFFYDLLSYLREKYNFYSEGAQELVDQKWKKLVNLFSFLSEATLPMSQFVCAQKMNSHPTVFCTEYVHLVKNRTNKGGNPFVAWFQW